MGLCDYFLFLYLNILYRGNSKMTTQYYNEQVWSLLSTEITRFVGLTNVKCMVYKRQHPDTDPLDIITMSVVFNVYGIGLTTINRDMHQFILHTGTTLISEGRIRHRGIIDYLVKNRGPYWNKYVATHRVGWERVWVMAERNTAR